MDYLKKAEELREQIIKWYRELHQFPEVGLNCPQTAAYICSQLEKMGIAYQTYEDHSGIVAVLGKGGGKVAAIRADIDGLAVEEKNNLPYASGNGNMHACGHDAHTAILLACASVFREMEEELPGYVKLIFQPSEERLDGAAAMIRDGALENPRPNRLFVCHVGGLVCKNLPTGSVVVPRKYAFASHDIVKVTITGKGGHAATPEAVIDPIVAAARVIENLQTIVSREIKADNPAVVSVTNVTAGGGVWNAIPDKAELVISFRALNPETRKYLRKRIEEISGHTAAVSGAKAEVEDLVGCPPVVNDETCSEEFMESARKILPEESLHWMDELNMGGEDVSFMTEMIPSVYFMLLNCTASDDGIVYPHHNARFRIDESVLYYAVALNLQAISDYFSQS